MVYFITYKSQPALWSYLTSAAFQISPRNRKYLPDLAAYVSFSMEDCTVEFFLWLFSVLLRPFFMSDSPTKKRITKVNVVSTVPAGLRPGRSVVQHRSLQNALLWTVCLLWSLSWGHFFLSSVDWQGHTCIPMQRMLQNSWPQHSRKTDWFFLRSASWRKHYQFLLISLVFFCCISSFP